jgi:hypothetical protein
VPENDSNPREAKPRRFRREPRTASVSREAVMGLDNLERKFGFGGAAIALVLALFFIPHLIKNTTITVTAKALKNGSCPKGYTLLKGICSRPEITHPSYWVPQFLVFLVVGGAIFAFSYFRKRPGVIVGSFLLGLATGTAGIFFLALGAWLSVRAFRLQKYGDPTFRGSNVKARERAQERRANRGVRSKASKSTTTASTSRTTPAPSKRYTPKKTNRR